MSRLGVLLALCAACVQSNEVRCADGRLCAPGYYCDDENMRCLSADQVAACAGREEGAECSFGGAPGACRRGACEPLVCGDGVRSVGEACDGADLGGNDCTSAGFYDTAGLACTEFCTFDTEACTGECGDNIVNGDELCDGAPPPVSACIEYGLDAGRVSCGSESCGLSFATCGRFGWVAEASALSAAYALDGTSEHDLWVVGEDLATNTPQAAHFDGAAWTPQTLPMANTPIAVAVAGAGDVWVIGEQNGTLAAVLLHLANGQWSPVTGIPAGDYRDVHARAADEVYLAADFGVTRWNGSSWEMIGALTAVEAIDATAATDLWAARGDGTLQHWNGTAWLPAAVAVAVEQIDAVAFDDVWVVGTSTTSPTRAAVAHWNGATWTVRVDPATTAASVFPAVAASANNDAWISTASGEVHHWNGLHWLNAGDVVVDRTYGGFVAIGRFGDTYVAASFDGFVYRHRGFTYARYETGSSASLAGSWSWAANEVIAIDGRAAAYHFDGVTWVRHVIDPATLAQNNRAIWGAAVNDVWVGGSFGRIFRWNGATWTNVHETASEIIDVIGFSPTDVWFVGSGVTHYDGMSFAPVAGGPTGTLYAAAGSGPNDVWLLGPGAAGGTSVYRWNGTAWATTQLDRVLADLVVLAPNDAFAIANDNLVMRWNGSTWAETALPTSAADALDRIAANAADDVFAITPTRIFHFDGSTWTRVRAPADIGVFNRKLTNVWTAPDRIDFTYGSGSGLVVGSMPMRRLARSRLWSCRTIETGCNDGVDDDCDGASDARDTDCQ